jgi:hypothetical protein
METYIVWDVTLYGLVTSLPVSGPKSREINVYNIYSNDSITSCVNIGTRLFGTL